jgi:hypothetical protein
MFMNDSAIQIGGGGAFLERTETQPSGTIVGTTTPNSAPPLFALKEIIPAMRDNPVIPLNGSATTSFIWAGGRPFFVPFCWQAGAYVGLAIDGASPTTTYSLPLMLGAASFAGAAEGLLVIINDLAAGHSLKEAIQHAICWAAANFSGALAWQALANEFLNGLSDMTLADIDKLAGPMAKVGGAAAATFALVLLATKIALRCWNPEHYGAANTETIIRDVAIFSFIFVGPTDATFCLSSLNTWFNQSGALANGFAAAGLGAVLKQITLSATGAFLGGLTGVGMAVLCHGIAFKVVPFLAEWVTTYFEDKQPDDPGSKEDDAVGAGPHQEISNNVVVELNIDTPLITMADKQAGAGHTFDIEEKLDHEEEDLESRRRCAKLSACYNSCTLF